MRSVCVCRCGFGARFALGFAHELAVLAGCLTLVHACVCGSVAVFCVRCVTRPCGSIERFRLRFTPVFFPLSGKKRRLAGSCVPVPPGRDRLRAFSRRWCGCRARLERGADLRGDALSVAVFCVWCVTRPCGSVDAFCLRFTPVFFPLSGKKETACVILRSCSAGSRSPSCVLAALVRLSGTAGTRSWSAGRCAFCRRVCPSVCVCHRGSIAAFCLGSRLSFFLCQEKRDGLRHLAFLFRRVEIAFVRSRGVGAVIRLGGFTSGLCVYLWRSRRDTEDAGDGERRTGLAARPLCVFAQSHWPCNAFRGEYAGATRPRLRQRVFDSLDSLQGLVECQSTLYAAGLGWCEHVSLQKVPTPQSAHPRLQSPGTRKDLTGSDLWPVRSCCMSIISTRTIGDLPDSDLWSGRSCIIARQQEEAGTAGLT